MTNSIHFRKGKQCRERWNNYLNPVLNKSEWTIEEDILMLQYIKNSGKRWSKLSVILQGRTENGIKNRFFALIKKQKYLL